MMGVEFRDQIRLLGNHGRVSVKDKPTLVGENLIYVSTHEKPRMSRTGWTAVYNTHLKTGSTRRLTHYGISDFSPAVSKSGNLTAVASYGEKGWSGDVEALATDIFIFKTRDGSDRIKVVEFGGWPTWFDDSTFYFHRRCKDGWWSVFKAILPPNFLIDSNFVLESVSIVRITPPGLHAFTPAATPGNKTFIAVATRRHLSDFRHIELYDLEKNEFIELTRLVSPTVHHFNPFISFDATLVGYHRCRGGLKGSPRLFLENLQTPFSPNISVFRIDGSFPSFSRNGDRVALVELPGLFVANWDGSNRREVFSGMAFATAWDPVRTNIGYTSTGPTFAQPGSTVHVISMDIDDNNNYTKLTTRGNNAFPSPSPDGKRVVFRSDRSGHKNLHIMDAAEGESGGLERITDGAWTDTMCNWSPDGDWIAFASDRENNRGFGIFVIHPNGTGLRRVFRSGLDGRANHPSFSPDGKSIVFTSDEGGVSAEPISNPHHYQPYGDIFTIRLDGSELRRLTHNSYEDGTPFWGPMFMNPRDVSDGSSSKCEFEDCHWLAEEAS